MTSNFILLTRVRVYSHRDDLGLHAQLLVVSADVEVWSTRLLHPGLSARHSIERLISGMKSEGNEISDFVSYGKL